jgi:hypothetical protein
MLPLEKMMHRYLIGEFNTASEILAMATLVKEAPILVKAYAIPLLMVLIAVEIKRA